MTLPNAFLVPTVATAAPAVIGPCYIELEVGGEFLLLESGDRFLCEDSFALPGAPTIIYAASNINAPAETEIEIIDPISNGGSPILAYRLYLDGAVRFTTMLSSGEFGGYVWNWPEFWSGTTAEVSAITVAGEGPKSLPVAVVAIQN